MRETVGADTGAEVKPFEARQAAGAPVQRLEIEEGEAVERVIGREQQIERHLPEGEEAHESFGVLLQDFSRIVPGNGDLDQEERLRLVLLQLGAEPHAPRAVEHVRKQLRAQSKRIGLGRRRPS